MGLRVNTNVKSITANKHLMEVSDRLHHNFRRLASGLRIARAADDPAGLGISERMRGQIRSLGQAERNTADGTSLVQTAEGALNETNSNLLRLRELAIQSVNETYSDEDRQVMDIEFQELIQEIDRIATTTSFNGTPLLNDDPSVADGIVIQAGSEGGEVITINMPVVTTDALGLTDASATVGTNVLDSVSAEAALDVIDAALNAVNGARGQLGATQNRLDSSLRTIRNVRENLSSSESRIRDLDVAVETADMTRNQIVQQAAVSVLSQANSQPQIALSLLQN
jgi:flagellin